jgi:ATP-binding cassette subfamily F protein uup
LSAILTAQGVKKSFGTRAVLRDASFAVQAEDRIGLVGLNGAGKSTLLRLLVAGPAPSAAAARGDHPDYPDAGLVTRKRGLRLAFVPQEPQLDLAATIEATLEDGLSEHRAAVRAFEAAAERAAGAVGEALTSALAEQAAHADRVAQLGGWNPAHELRGIAAALDLPAMHQPCGTLSIGERRRVALARALLAQPELLALDEPTNHLDAATAAWLEDRLRKRAGALLLVTHDRYLLERVATRIVEIDRGEVRTYDGSYSRFLELSAARLAAESEREQRRRSFVRRELDWIRRGPSARATKQKARIDRFEQAVAAAPTLPRPGDRMLALRLPTGGRLGKTILAMRGLGKSLGGKPLFRDLTLTLKPGDRIGIVGPNGAGKTTLVKTLLGQVQPDQGELEVGVNTRFAFLDQGRAELRDDHTVLEEVAGDGDHVMLEDGPVHVRTFLRMMLFDDGFADTPVGVLSGGERNRVQLAKLLRRGGNLLVLDEPTNDLDLLTLGVLEEALVEFPGCALVVSHDRWFLDRVATGILAFEGNGQVGFYEGSYSDYLAKRPPSHEEAERRRTRAAAAERGRGGQSESASGAPRMRSTKPAIRKLTFKEREELAGMEGAIEAAEHNVVALEQTLADPAVYRDRGQEVPALVAELDQARAAVERLYARWQELEGLGK